jgi:rubredoxin
MSEPHVIAGSMVLTEAEFEAISGRRAPAPPPAPWEALRPVGPCPKCGTTHPYGLPRYRAADSWDTEHGRAVITPEALLWRCRTCLYVTESAIVGAVR